MFYMADMAFVDIKPLSKSAPGHAIGKSNSNNSDIRIRKPRLCVAFADAMLSAQYGINRVVALRTWNKVARIDAPLVIAGMAEKPPLRHRTDAKLICDAVRPDGLLVDANTPVTSLQRGSRPDPAIASLVDLFPKAGRKISALPFRLQFGATRMRTRDARRSVRRWHIVLAPTHSASAHRSFFAHSFPPTI